MHPNRVLKKKEVGAQEAQENQLKNTQRSRHSSMTMTKYEHAKVIGIRAEQISRGAQQFVSDDGTRFDPIAIATRELHAGVLPFLVVRKLPDGTEEQWHVNELINPF